MQAELRGEEGVPSGYGILGRMLPEYVVDPESPYGFIDCLQGETLLTGGIEDGSGPEGDVLCLQPPEDSSRPLMPQAG